MQEKSQNADENGLSLNYNGKFFKKTIPNAQIYIGKNAGQYIEEKIINAKKSIKIISPYLGFDKINLLTKKYINNIDVKVITTDDSNSDYKHLSSSKIMKVLIKQERSTLDSIKDRNALLIFLEAFTIIGLFIITIFLLLGYFQIIFSYNYLYLLIPYLLIIFICFLKHNLWKVYVYNYSTFFPVIIVNKKFFVKRKNKYYWSLLHTKLYIIDDEYAYTGSVNFTNSGFKNNFETCIKILDKDTILELSKFFDCLYERKWSKRNIASLGRMIYNEPIN